MISKSRSDLEFIKNDEFSSCPVIAVKRIDDPHVDQWLSRGQVEQMIAANRKEYELLQEMLAQFEESEC
jgi:hypothetical protein